LENYDQVYNEAMADHFAMRYGAGPYLASALEKANHTSVFYSSGFFLFIQTMELIRFSVVMLVGTAALFTGAAAVGLFIASIATLSLWLNGDNYRSFEYDDLSVRYKRMRNQMVELLKHKALSNEEKQEALDSLSQLDDIVARAIEYKSPLTAIGNFVFSSNRNAKRMIDLEHQIEEFISNQLFVNAAKLTLQK
jgi:ABC-type multidrug transport system fused ATPase/permease subunit